VGPDETVLEDECVDAVVDLGLGGIGSPFEKQNVIFIKLRFKVPFGLGYVREQLRECVPDPRLTSLHLRGRHEEGVVAVVRRDAVDILSAQRLGVMLKELRSAISAFGGKADIRRTSQSTAPRWTVCKPHLQITQGRELLCGATCSLVRTMREGQSYRPS
jgi:hypothetical protein